MARVKIEGDELVVEMDGAGETIMALRSEIRMPLTHVTGARAKPPELFDETFIIRVFGASIFETHIGYYWKKGDGLAFMDIHNLRGGQIVAFDLTQERLKHLYIECEAPETAEQLAERIASALRSRKGSTS